MDDTASSASTSISLRHDVQTENHAIVTQSPRFTHAARQRQREPRPYVCGELAARPISFGLSRTTETCPTQCFVE